MIVLSLVLPYPPIRWVCMVAAVLWVEAIARFRGGAIVEKSRNTNGGASLTEGARDRIAAVPSG